MKASSFSHHFSSSVFTSLSLSLFPRSALPRTRLSRFPTSSRDEKSYLLALRRRWRGRAAQGQSRARAAASAAAASPTPSIPHREMPTMSPPLLLPRPRPPPVLPRPAKQQAEKLLLLCSLNHGRRSPRASPAPLAASTVATTPRQSRAAAEHRRRRRRRPRPPSPPSSTRATRSPPWPPRTAA